MKTARHHLIPVEYFVDARTLLCILPYNIDLVVFTCLCWYYSLSRSSAATECGGAAANRATPLASRTVGIAQYPIRRVSLFPENPLQDLKRNPATGLQTGENCGATVRNTLCKEAVSSYRRQLTCIKLVKITKYILCILSLCHQPKPRDGRCSFDFFSSSLIRQFQQVEARVSLHALGI